MSFPKPNVAKAAASSAARLRFGLIAGAIAVPIGLGMLALRSNAGRLLPSAILLALAVAAALLALRQSRAPRRRRASLSRSGEHTPHRNVVTVGSGLQSGDVLGQYQLLTCVGQGGMGRVWAARRMGSPLQRLVAVKTGLGAKRETREFEESFTDEARIASLLRHPNVCGVYEFGRHDGLLYQALEWCDGASLRTLLDNLPERRLDFALAARIVAHVSAGLHAAHQLEDDDGVPLHVVHRDVSPQNILISRHGQVKVTDFGVAKAAGQLHRAGQGGEIRGKPMYMAPEQITMREVDQRSDIYSLGCVLYEATVGRGPFEREGTVPSLYQVLAREAPSPRTVIPEYPEALARIVCKALARDPAARFQSAEEFGVALEEWFARSHVIVTEQVIADLMSRTAGEFIREKARRIEEALTRLAPQSPRGLGALLPPQVASMDPAAPSVAAMPRIPSMPALPSVPVVSRRTVIAASASVDSETAARPTIPVGRRRAQDR